MRVLAIDLGEKRVGLAISDPLGIAAQPLPVQPRHPEEALFGRLARLCGDEGVERVVLGFPLRLDGSEGPAAAAARRFAGRLGERLGLPIELCDERLTTAAAERVLIAGGLRRKRRRDLVDSAAASLLLQGYLARKTW